MAQILTLVSLFAVALALVWSLRSRFLQKDSLDVSIRLDHSTPGAHLIWDIVNIGVEPIALTRLVIHSKDLRTTRHLGRHPDENDMVPLAHPTDLACGDRVLVPTDVDWSLLAARAIAVEDAAGREHKASRRQLRAVQAQMRELIDRRVQHTASARDWLYGAANLGFGFVILGLGFFMLMWVIATG